MSIIQKLSLRSIQKNKTTSIVTIVGMIMSLALMTGLFLLSASLLQFAKDDYAYKHGTVEIVISQIDRETLESLPRPDLIKEKTLLALLGAERNSSEYYAHSNVIGIEKRDINTSVSMRLSKGRFPEKPGEALITAGVNEFRDEPLSVGEQVSISLVKPDTFSEKADVSYEEAEDMTITIVGILSVNPLPPPMVLPTYFVVQTPEEIEAAQTLWTGFTLKNISDQAIKDFRGDLKLDYHVTSLAEYSPGVSSSGRFFIQGFVTVLVIIVAVAGIGLIQNGFMISLSQRMRELSLLSSVGMTRRQKWQMVLREGLIMYLVALPIGILSGAIAMGIVFRVLTPPVQRWMQTKAILRLTWDPLTMILIAVVGLVTVMFATLLPAIRTSRHTPLAGVRRQEEVVVKAKELRTPGMIRKLFGMEGDIAWKNLRRNRRKYRVTLMSLVFSLVLYLSIASLTHFAGAGADIAMSRDAQDLEVYSSRHEDFPQRQEMEKLAQTQGIEESFAVYSIQASFSEGATQLQPGALKEAEVRYGEFISYDPITMQILLKEWGLKEEDLKGMRGVLVNQMRYREDEGRLRTEMIFDTPPAELSAVMSDAQKDAPIKISLVKALPEAMTRFNTRWGQSLKVIVLPETMEQLRQTGKDLEFFNLYMSLRIFVDENEHYQVAEALRENVSTSDLSLKLHDNFGFYQRQRDFVMISKVLFFGFATIIALISLVNIYNSLISSLRLRRKEFAMLRSVGMEERSFRRMIRFESYFYACKLLLYGLPLGVLISYMIHQYLGFRIDFAFEIPVWHFALATVSIVAALILIMSLGSRGARKGNILDTLKMEMDL